MQTSVLFRPAPSLPRIELVVPTYGFDQFATDGQSPISRARGSTYFYPSPTTGWEWTRRPKRVFSSPSSQPRNREKVQAWGSPPCTELSNRAVDSFGWSQNPVRAPVLKSIFHA